MVFEPALDLPFEIFHRFLRVALGDEAALHSGEHVSLDEREREVGMCLVDAVEGLIDIECLGVFPEDGALAGIDACSVQQLPDGIGDLHG